VGKEVVSAIRPPNQATGVPVNVERGRGSSTAGTTYPSDFGACAYPDPDCQNARKSLFIGARRRIIDFSGGYFRAT
jgi:hypothetical protein